MMWMLLSISRWTCTGIVVEGTNSKATVSEPAAKARLLLIHRAAGSPGPGAWTCAMKRAASSQVARPAGAQQHDIAGAHFDVLGARGSVQVLGRDEEIDRQDIHMLQARDVQQHAAAGNWRHGVDREPLDAAGVRLRDFGAIAQFSRAREVAQGIDVCADVCAERQGLRR